jgi:DNA polymerase-3 subunit alpha
VVLFAETLNRFADLVAEDRILFIKGKVDRRREKPNVIVEELISLEDATEKLAARVRIRLDAKDVSKEKISEIKSICERHRGKSQVYVSLNTDKGRISTAADKSLRVNPDVDFCRKMKLVVGADNFQLG